MRATFVFALAIGIAQSTSGQPRLFEFSAQNRGNREKNVSIAADRQQPIQIQLEAVAEQAKRIEIPFFDGRVFHAEQREREGFIRHNADTFSWSGQILVDDGWRGDVVITVHKNAMAASIYAPVGLYSIIPQADGAHILAEIDPSRLPGLSDDALTVGASVLRAENAVASAPPTPQVDNGSLIDVLIVYSDEVRAFLGGTTQATAYAQQIISATNAAYQNSAIVPRLRLVHAMEIAYDESGNSSTDLTFIRTHAGVATARNIYQADAVGFVVEAITNTCGSGYVMSQPFHNAEFAPYAYSVIGRQCPSVTYAHEIGHNQGANHDPADTPPSQPVFPYAFAHYVTGGPTPFRTIMAVTCGFCSPVPHFSNPGVNYNSQPTGIADQRDNARTINNTPLVFSRFRNSAFAITNLRSRKVHGSTAYDIDLRPGIPQGIECRAAGSGGSHQVLVTFPSAVSVGGVSVASRDGLATATRSVSGAVVTVNLASVANAQTLGITLHSVSAGSDTADVFFPFHVLLGDTNSNGFVSASDITQVKSLSGQAVSASNFRLDVNVSGSINSSDISQVKFLSGTQLP